MQLIRTPVPALLSAMLRLKPFRGDSPFSVATPAFTTPSAAWELIVKHGPQQPVTGLLSLQEILLISTGFYSPP